MNQITFEACVDEMYTSTIRWHLAGFSSSHWVIFHVSLKQYLLLVQIFFNLSLALITSPITCSQADLSSLTLPQHKLKATLY